MTITIAPLGVLFGLAFYYLRSKTIDKVKDYIHDSGGVFVSISSEFKFFNRWSNTYVLIYTDKKQKTHECKIRIGLSDYAILNDMILKVEAPAVFMPVYDDIVTETRIFTSEQGTISVALTSSEIQVGDKVLVNNIQARDGKYKLGFLHYIYVKDGRVC